MTWAILEGALSFFWLGLASFAARRPGSTKVGVLVGVAVGFIGQNLSGFALGFLGSVFPFGALDFKLASFLMRGSP